MLRNVQIVTHPKNGKENKLGRKPKIETEFAALKTAYEELAIEHDTYKAREYYSDKTQANMASKRYDLEEQIRNLTVVISLLGATIINKENQHRDMLAERDYYESVSSLDNNVSTVENSVKVPVPSKGEEVVSSTRKPKQPRKTNKRKVTKK